MFDELFDFSEEGFEEQRQIIRSEKETAVDTLSQLEKMCEADEQDKIYRCYMDMITINRMLDAILRSWIA